MKKIWLDADGLFKRIAAAKQQELEEKELLEYKDAEVAYLEEKLEKMEKEGSSTKEELTALKKEISETVNAKYKTLLEVVKQQGEALQNISTSSLKANVEEAASSIVKQLEKKKDVLKSMVQGASKSIEMEVKDVTSGASVVDNTYSLRVPGIGQIPVRPTLMEARFRAGTLGANSGGKLTYIDQETLTRNAANVAECDPIPASDIEWKEYDEKAEKIGDSMPVCIEALEDFDFIRSEVENFLMENILLRVDEQLLLGDGASPNLVGIDTIAQSWSVGVGSPIEALAQAVDTPTIANVAFSAISQVQNSGQNNSYQPDYVDMNPQDVQLMMLEKDADKNSITDKLVTIDANGNIRVAGVLVVANPLVPQDVMYVGDYRRGQVYTHRPMTLTIATQHASDFIEDRVRIKGTTRKLLLVRNVNKNAFLKVDSIAAAITGLTKP